MKDYFIIYWKWYNFYYKRIIITFSIIFYIKAILKLIKNLILQKFTILFFSIYNKLSYKDQNYEIQRLINLADYMINIFKKDEIEILNEIQSEINKNFSEEDFKNFKIFENRYTSKDPLEICFALCILSKNINLMKIFFNEYLKVNLFIYYDFNSINLENPFASKLFDLLFNNLLSIQKF